MLPNRWSPTRDLNTLQRELDDVLRRVFGTTHDEVGETTMAIAPAINSFVKDGVFHLEAELPGVDTDKLDVRIDGHNLLICGERRTATETKEIDYLVRETRCNTFERRLVLPQGADTEKVHASYKDGLLEVTMPMLEAEQGGRKVTVEGLGTGKKSKEVH